MVHICRQLLEAARAAWDSEDANGGTAYEEASPVSVVQGFYLAGESFLLKVKRVFLYKKV